MSKNLQEQINQIKKTMLNQNLSTNSITTYNKLNELENSLYRYNQLSKAGLNEDAKLESEKANNLVNNFNSSEEGTVLSGYISNTKYVWNASDDSCEACQNLDGTEYESIDDIPDKPHPNCNCYIEEVEIEDYDGSGNSGGNGGGDDPCDCYETVSEWLSECEDACEKYEYSSDEGDNALDELQSIGSQIQSYASEKMAELQESQDEINQLKDDALVELQEIIDQTASTIQIFWTNYEELKALKEELGYYLDQSAEYYHTKANCEAAQLGDVGAQIAEMLGYLREYLDFIKEFIFEGYTLEKTFEDMIHDLEVNEAGRKLGKEHPNEAPEDIIKRPDGLPHDFW